MTDKTKAAKAKTELKVLVSGKISDGAGGFFKKGDTFTPGNGSDPEGLKAKGLVG